MGGRKETTEESENPNVSTVNIVGDSTVTRLQAFSRIGLKLSDVHVEKDLFEANALTSVIVDCMHGVLPGKSSNNNKIEHLIERLRMLSKKKFEQISTLELHEYKWKKDLGENDRKLVEKVSFQIWHEVSLLRRILARILKALQPTTHSSAYDEGDTTASPQTVSDFCEFKNHFDALIVNQAYSILERTERKEMKWYDFAVMYEATLILRARGLSSPALLMAEKAQKLELHSDTDTIANTSIRGLVSFNPELFSHIPEDSPQKVLFSISKAITLNSSRTAADSVNRFYSDDSSCSLHDIFFGLWAYLQENRDSLHFSGLLHVESTMRVICHNIINESRLQKKGTDNKTLKLKFSLVMRDFYEFLNEVLEDNPNLDSWMGRMIRMKIRQDGGILLSNFVPVELFTLAGSSENSFPSSRVQDEESRRYLADAARDIFEQLEDGWGKAEWRDCPARIRKILRSAIAKDMIKRSYDGERGADLEELDALIGRPAALNPFTFETTKSSLSAWFWGATSIKSRHLRHFPQSNINKSQISIIMAYMQLLQKRPERNGFFEGLDRMLESGDTENDQWRISNKVTIRPQFTLGHLKKGLNDKHITQIDEKVKKGETEVNNFVRSNVTRINRMDPLMFVATSMNFIEDLFKKEVSDDKEVLRRLDRAARQSLLIVNEHLDLNEKVHVHDIIHAAQEAAQSPMRVIQYHLDSRLLEKRELIDQILRVSFSRLYVLTIRVEQIARLLLERPLRQPFQDSSVLMIDQVRVLLKYMYTEWLNAEKIDYEKGGSLPNVAVDKETLRRFNELRKTKGHLGNHFPSKEYADRQNVEMIKEDIALEYILSNGLTRRSSSTKSSMRAIAEKNHEHLNFSNISTINWGDFIEPSFEMNLENSYQLTPEEKEKLKNDLNEESTLKGEKAIPSQPILGTDDIDLKKAFKSLQENTKREWILWSRLAHFPACFNGRPIVSSTTFSNNSSDQDSEVTSRLWGKLKEAYLSDMDN